MDQEKKRRYRYDAFLSYAHDDETTIQWLEGVLERTWVPGKKRRSLFRDRNRLRSGALTGELTEALDNSRFLIVCCSEAAATSPWINREIRAFWEATDDPTRRIRSVLACQVGKKTDGTTPLPQALADLQAQLGDELYLADLRGDVVQAKGKASKQLKMEAFALLAPLLGVPDREAVAATLVKRRLFLAAMAATMLLISVALWFWTRGDAYQIRTLLQENKEVTTGADAVSVERWVETLAEAGNKVMAVETARQIPDPADRISAISAIAKILQHQGRQQDVRLLSEAITLLSVLQDPYEYGNALEKILTAAGNRPVPGAMPAAVEAHRLILTIEHPQLRLQALAQLANIFALLNRPDSVAAIAGAAARIASPVAADYRAWSYGTLARAFWTVKDSGNATHLVEGAFSSLKEISAARRRIDGAVELSKNFQEAGWRSLAQKAIQLATSELTDSLSPALRIFLTEAVAKTLIADGNRGEARRLTLACHSYLPKIEDADSRARSTARLAVMLARVGLSAEAQTTGRQALSEVPKIETDERKADVWAQVLGDVAHLLPAKKVKQEAGKALDLVRTHPDDRGRSLGLAHIAAALAQVQALREARLLASQCTTSNDKLQAYRIILRQHYQLAIQ